MARIRFKCPSINRGVVSSEIAEENYQKSLLPERDDLLAAEETICSNGNGEGSETLALEVFRKCMQVIQSDDNPAMGVDVSYPTWIAEKLMLQLLPEPLVSFASGGGEVLIRPVEACVWFEDETSTIASTTCDSGGFLMVQEMEFDVEDLFCKLEGQRKKLLVESSSPVDSDVSEDFRKLKVQDFETAPVSFPLSSSQETRSQKSIQGLGGAVLQTTSEVADCRVAVKPFEAPAYDSGMWNFPEMSDLEIVEPCTIPMILNPRAEYDCEVLSDDLSCLLDSSGATPSMLDELAPDLGIATQFPQERGPCSVSVCNTLLEDPSIDSSIRAMKPLQTQNLSENLKIIKNDRFEQSPRVKDLSCDRHVKSTSNSGVTFVDLTGADGFSPSDLIANDTEENSGIFRNQERRLPGGTGISLSASTLKSMVSLCTAAKNDNSDNSTLSDEKTQCSTAPPPSFLKFNSTRSVGVLLPTNEKHVYKEVISRKQSSESNPKNFERRQNSTRQGITRRDLEAIHSQRRGPTPLAAASFEEIPQAVTAPPSSAATAPSQHPKNEQLFGDKCSGSREVKMMKRKPLVIVAANVMEPDGPILPRRRSSYQRILALENEQLQVVERERHLPVDLILSPSTCLIVYTAAKMKLNWDPSFVYKECSAFIADIIVNCQMKAMSFSFGKCYMVFEGEPAFTSFILQATPKLAVAAAGFGMQVQCFVSGSPQCTEDIALMCIERVRKKAKRPYPLLMSECENDDELFLEQFASLNPLAAHAILCLNRDLNVPLSKFMLLSHDAMADALQGFEVPAESLRLFKLQSEYRKLKEGQGPRGTMRPEETYPDNFPFLPLASSGIDDFETTFNDSSGRGGYRNPFCPNLDRIFEMDPLGDGPTNEEHIAFSPPLHPAFQLDPKFDEDFTPERCFKFWDDPYQLSECEHSPVEPWLEERPTQRPTTQRNSNRSQKPGYVQSCLDDWIEKMKRAKSDPNCTKQESESEFLNLAKATIPSQALHQKDFFPTLNFELHGQEKVLSTINTTPAKRAASALDLFRHQKGISRPLQKKLKPLSRPPHLRSTVVDVTSIQAAQAHLSKRFCFKPVTNPSRFSRSS
ncbi:hypothetical protein KC19_1G134100 [Ceratodon purpureus]|uniref:Uncharacterized protein n=1 Tax=Ceratodon purpureus TaxID=3225 RepID=A0A8T0J7S4_CERPU|nr:hypothetical protein KC19_1G134100 [Ceratodon purpureus]